MHFKKMADTIFQLPKNGKKGVKLPFPKKY